MTRVGATGRGRRPRRGGRRRSNSGRRGCGSSPGGGRFLAGPCGESRSCGFGLCLRFEVGELLFERGLLGVDSFAKLRLLGPALLQRFSPRD